MILPESRTRHSGRLSRIFFSLRHTRHSVFVSVEKRHLFSTALNRWLLIATIIEKQVLLLYGRVPITKPFQGLHRWGRQDKKEGEKDLFTVAQSVYILCRESGACPYQSMQLLQTCREVALNNVFFALKHFSSSYQRY